MVCLGNRYIFIKIKNIKRGGEVVSRWSHKPKVVGSNPTFATKHNKNEQRHTNSITYFLRFFSGLQIRKNEEQG